MSLLCGVVVALDVARRLVDFSGLLMIWDIFAIFALSVQDYMSLLL